MYEKLVYTDLYGHEKIYPNSIDFFSVGIHASWVSSVGESANPTEPTVASSNISCWYLGA